MAVIDQTLASLSNLTAEEIRGLKPAQRRRFAELCRHWAKVAEAVAPAPPKSSGILYDLRSGRHD